VVAKGVWLDPIRLRLVSGLGRIIIKARNFNWWIKTMVILVIFNSLGVLGFCSLDVDILVSIGTTGRGIAGRILYRNAAIAGSGDARGRSWWLRRGSGQ
jgi:hypothetical protein